MSGVHLTGRRLERVYPGRTPRRALAGVDLEAVPGELVVVLGPSGAGKTTLLNLLGGIDRPTEGTVAVDGVELAELGEQRLSAFRRDRVGFVFQTFGLLPVLTAFENVEVPLRLRGLGAGERGPLVRAALEAVGLATRSRHFPDQLSGGERQRVAVARALVGSPELLLADEPTSQLDSANAAAVAAILLEHVRETGATAVVATHDASLAEIADRVVRLAAGRVV